MSEAATIPAERMNQLTDQLWRRLGISDTFQRLLVREVAARPAEADVVQARASEGMGAGAVKFFDLTFGEMVETLVRGDVLEQGEVGLALAPDFAEKVEQAIAAEEAGVSRVEPTPGATLESIKRRAAEREERNTTSTTRARTRGPSRAARATARTGSAKPRTRRASREKADPGIQARASVRRPAPKPAPKRASAKELFTSRKMNRLLDSLERPLFKDQVGRKVDLRGPDLERFLEILAALDVVRLVHDDMVELHWRGRELHRTTDGERRMALVEIVRELRERFDA